MDNPMLWKLDLAELTKLSVASTKFGPVLRLTIEVPLIPEIDVSGLAHDVYGKPGTVTLSPLQASMPAAAD